MALLRRKTAGPRDPSRRRRTRASTAATTPAPRRGSSGCSSPLLIAIGVYLAFAKKIPFTSEGFQLHATFENATTLRPTSPVRIAGVNVGKVTGIERDGDAASVTFSVDDQGQPIHEDASVDIRPRLFLEGNFFLDLDPGSPSSPVLADGDTIPMTQTATAVQIDEVLDRAPGTPRARACSGRSPGFGTALNYQPTAAADVGQDPDVQGKTARRGAAAGASVRRARRARHRDRQRGAARPGPARPLRA